MFKDIYLWLVTLVSIINYYKKRINVVYVMSFNNNLNLIEKIAESIPDNRELIIFYNHDNPEVIQRLNAMGIRTVHFKNNLYFIFITLPILLSARLILCDNYFPFLGGLVLPKSVKIVQLWHANGAVKQFGWGDPRTRQRSINDQHRFQKVYNHFNQYVVASKAMGRVFVHDYHISPSRIRLLGYPRSDQFFNQIWINRSREEIFKRFPQFRNHRVILYAPTYRSGVTFNPPNGLIQALTCDPKAVVLVRLHPALRSQFGRIERQMGTGKRLWYLNNLSTAKLLTITDTLVTDYSSVAFDYSLLPNAHSMLFFTFDLKSYEKSPGCQPDFLKWLPGKPIIKVHDLKDAIQKNVKTDFKSFNLRWNTYNDGKASIRFINHYIKPLRRRN